MHSRIHDLVLRYSASRDSSTHEQTMLSPDEWKSREWPRIAFGWSREAEWAATIRYAWLRMIERVSEPSFLRFLYSLLASGTWGIILSSWCIRAFGGIIEREEEKEKWRRELSGEEEREEEGEIVKWKVAGDRKRAALSAKYANDALKRDISALGAVVEIRWSHLESYCFHDADGVDHLSLVGRT